MSAVAEGRKLRQKGAQLTREMQDGPTTGISNDVRVQGGAKAEQFQRKFGGDSAMDDEMNQRMQLMDDQGMTPFGQVYYDDKVGKWLQDKQKVAEVANLDSWFGAQFNQNDLASRQFAQQIYPEYYSEREREMMSKAKEALNLKFIQLRGPQSKEDLYKLWLINTGRVVLPEDWDRIGGTSIDTPPSDTEAQKRLFKQGLVRPPQPRSAAQRDQTVQNNRRLWGNVEAASIARNPFSLGETPGNSLGPGRNRSLQKGAESIGLNTFNTLQGV